MNPDEMQAGRWIVGQGLVTPDADPFPITPPSAEEQARVESDAALLTAAAGRLEQMLADGARLPWMLSRFETISGPAVDVMCPIPGQPGASTGLTRVAVLGTQDAATAELIAALINAGPDLVALLRDAAREATEVGSNGFAVALARKVMGESA